MFSVRKIRKSQLSYTAFPVLFAQRAIFNLILISLDMEYENHILTTQSLAKVHRLKVESTDKLNTLKKKGT